MNVISHINRMKGGKKKHMIISIDAEKNLKKSNSFIMKQTKKLPQRNKSHIKKYTVNIILNCERLKAFPLRSGVQQGCLLLSLLFNMALKVLARAIR